MNYLGLDVHKRDSYIAVIDDDGELVEEVRVDNANLDDFAQDYQEAKAVIEATDNYYTIYDTLDQYMDVVVADSGQTKAIGYAEAINDRLDASYVPLMRSVCVRALVRGRTRLVEKRTGFKNEVHALLGKYGIASDWEPFSQELSFDYVGEMLMESFLTLIDDLTAQIKKIETLIEEIAASLPETQLLMTIPGVSFYSSLLITAEIGEIARFDSANQVVSYARLTPVVRGSPDSRTEGGISKRGSRELRWILVQCANVAVNRCHDPYLGGSTHD